MGGSRHGIVLFWIRRNCKVEIAQLSLWFLIAGTMISDISEQDRCVVRASVE